MATNLSSMSISHDYMCNQSNNHPLVHFVESYISPSIFIIGIITNAITVIVLRFMSLGNVMKVLLCTLCATDYFASSIGLVNNILEVVLFDGDMPFGYYCPGVIEVYTTYFLFLMLLCISHTIVIVISVIRVYSMIKPFESRLRLKTRLVVKILVAVFIAVFLLFIPTCFFIMWQTCFEDRNTHPACIQIFQRFPDIAKIKIYLNFLSLLFGPVVIIVNFICAVLIRRAMVKSIKEGQALQYTTNGDHYRGSQARKSMRITSVLFYTLVINTACIFPTFLQSLMLLIDSSELVFHKGNTPWAIFDVIAEILLQVIPCYNFWMFLIINKDFRRTFKRLIVCNTDDINSSTDNYINGRSQSGSQVNLSVFIKHP